MICHSYHKSGDNLAGHKGNPIQPLVAAINCALWVTYGLLKKPKRDYPVAIANAPGIIFWAFSFCNSIVAFSVTQFSKYHLARVFNPRQFILYSSRYIIGTIIVHLLKMITFALSFNKI